jgi:hypothetical protein
MTLFKKLFGHERDQTDRNLDRLALTLILIGLLIGLYSCYR